MRISLKVGATVYPLAGQAGVDERTHSSAGDFRISAQAQQELIQRVRSATVKGVDRGNLATTITFSTSRVFATAAEAFLYSLDHDGTLPRAGILVMDAIAPDGGITKRHLLDMVISPPSRRVIGCSVLLDYTATGGGVVYGGVLGAGTVAATGTITVTSSISDYELYVGARGYAASFLATLDSASAAAEIAANINGEPLSVVIAVNVGSIVFLTAKAGGAAGNAVTLTMSSSGLTRSAATLTGGVG